MAQKEGIRHKKPFEYSAAAPVAFGFLLIQSLSLWFPDPGKTVAALVRSAVEMMELLSCSRVILKTLYQWCFKVKSQRNAAENGFTYLHALDNS